MRKIALSPRSRFRSSVGKVTAEIEWGTPHPALRGAVMRYQGYAERAADPVTFRELRDRARASLHEFGGGVDEANT